jgi:hypothetical protein
LLISLIISFNLSTTFSISAPLWVALLPNNHLSCSSFNPLNLALAVFKASSASFCLSPVM